MSFEVTATLSGNVDVPAFVDWVSTVLDANIVYAQYPELNGQSISSIILEQIDTFTGDGADGLISINQTKTDSSIVLVTTYESQDVYETNRKKAFGYMPTKQPGNLNCSTDNVVVTGLSTYFTSNLEVGEEILSFDISTNAIGSIGRIASIESDTSLTLETNAAFNVSDKGYNSGNITGEPVLVWLQNLYEETYNLARETTFANM